MKSGSSMGFLTYSSKLNSWFHVLGFPVNSWDILRPYKYKILDYDDHSIVFTHMRKWLLRTTWQKKIIITKYKQWHTEERKITESMYEVILML